MGLAVWALVGLEKEVGVLDSSEEKGWVAVVMVEAVKVCGGDSAMDLGAWALVVKVGVEKDLVVGTS